MAAPPRHAIAQRSSARPTVPVTASTCTGCAAKSRLASSATRRPPRRVPRHARAPSTATPAQATACSAAFTAWNGAGSGGPWRHHVCARKLSTVSGRYDLCESVLRRLLPQKSFTHTSASGAPCCTSALSMIASRSSKTKPQMTELR